MTLYVIDLFVDYVMTRFRRNLTIRELSLDKALEIAVAMETATKDAIEWRNVQGDTPVHKVRGNRRRRNQ